MKILLTGGNGQLGSCFQDVVRNDNVELIVTDAQELDITDLETVLAFVDKVKPDFVVNAAAYTAVDKAETEIELATAVNEHGPANLAQACQQLHIPIIHVSTDYVFDGSATAPYTPDMPTNPQSVYGKTKLAGELKVVDACEKHVIIRTAWVFSEYGNNFVKTMLRLAQTRDELGVVADQYGCPTYAGDLAQAIYTICQQIQQGHQHWGVYHYCGDIATSWHGFAMAIFDEGFKQGIITKKPKVNAIRTEDYPVPAPRPSYSVMDSQLLCQAWFVAGAKWRMALNHVILAMKK